MEVLEIGPGTSCRLSMCSAPELSPPHLKHIHQVCRIETLSS